MNKGIFLKATILFLPLLFFSSGFLNLFAQVAQKPDLIPYRNGDLWGYADQNRQLKIAPVFEEAGFFNGTWAIVRQNQKYGIINRQGTFLAEPQYESLYPSINNLLAFRTSNRSGFLDTLGNEVNYTSGQGEPKIKHYSRKDGKPFPDFKFTQINPFYNGVAVAVYNDRKGHSRSTLIDESGRDLLSLKYEVINHWEVNGHNRYLIRRFKRKKKQYSYQYEKRQRYGLLNDRLEYVVPVKFRKIEDQNNFLIVYDGFRKAGLWDFENRRKLTRRRFDRIETTSHPARAAVTVLEKQGLIDSVGNYIIPLEKQVIKPDVRYSQKVKDFASLGLQYPNLFYVNKPGATIAVNPFGKLLIGFNHGTLSKLTDSLFLVSQMPKPGKQDYYFSDRSDVPVLGLIDRNGQLVVPPTYQYVRVNDQNSLVILSTHSLTSYFSGSGKRLADRSSPKPFTGPVVQPPLPDKVTSQELAIDNRNSCFHIQQALPNGYAIVGNTCLYTLKSYGVVNASGKVTVPFHYNQIYPLSATTLAVQQANKWGVLQIDGETVQPVIYDYLFGLEGGAFMAGKRKQAYNSYQWQSYHLWDSAGKAIANEEFFKAPTFIGETAWVPVKGGEVELTRSGKIISRKPLLIKNQYSPVKPGIFQKNDPNAWAFIDLNGRVVIPRGFSEVKPFREGLAAVAKDGIWGFIDKTNKIVIPLQYRNALSFSEGKAFVQTAEGYRVISRSGKFLFPDVYQDAQPYSEGLAAVKLNGRWGFIDEKGKLVIACKFPEVTAFRNGMATYFLSGNYGYLNKAGKLVVPPKYNYLQPFENGYGWMRKDKWYKVNHLGQVVDSAATLPSGTATSKSRTRFENNELFRLNPDGSETTLGKFAEIKPETEGFIGVKTKDLWYYIDEEGNRFFEED